MAKKPEIPTPNPEKESWDRVVELKAGRHVDDIPLDDEYWAALKKHQLTYNKK